MAFWCASPIYRAWRYEIRPHRRCWGVIFRMALVKGYRFTWGGGIFRPKPPVFDRSWRSPSKNTVKNSTEDTCSWTRPSKIGKRNPSCHECHACHAKKKMGVCATPATQKACRCGFVPCLPRKLSWCQGWPNQTKRASAMSATPATKNDGGSKFFRCLPRKIEDMRLCHA